MSTPRACKTAFDLKRGDSVQGLASLSPDATNAASEAETPANESLVAGVA